MPKTRQQRLAEERAGHPPSPPQFLENKPKPRGPIQTRAKTPNATVAAGPVVPAVQSAVQGESQALLHLWVDAGPEASGRPANDPTHQMMIPSSFVPELVTFVKNLSNQNMENVPKSSSKPSLDPADTKPGNGRAGACATPNGKQTSNWKKKCVSTQPVTTHFRNFQITARGTIR